MNCYIKDGQIATNIIILNGMQIINPTHEQYLEAGYTEFIEEEPRIITQTNEQIACLREVAYKERSDSYYIAWQKYLILNQPDKAEEAKQKWLNEIALIDQEYPYGDDTTTQE